MADETFAKVCRALGWRTLKADEPVILAEIRRLREAAGELERDRDPFMIEHMNVAEVLQVHGMENVHTIPLLVTTRAEMVESGYQHQGEPWQYELLELPSRRLNIVFDERCAREAHRILDETIRRWDDE